MFAEEAYCDMSSAAGSKGASVDPKSPAVPRITTSASLQDFQVHHFLKWWI